MRRAMVIAVLGMAVAVIGLLVGCSGSSNTNYADLGAMHIYATGDQWLYNLTGTFSPTAGGTETVTPATATLSWIGPSGTIVGSNILGLSVPVAYPGHSDTYVYSFAFTQAGDGTLTMTGLSPADNNPVAFDGGGSMVGPPATNLGSTSSWSGSAIAGVYGAFIINTTNQGVESVTVPAGTFQCYRVTGTKSLGGFVSSFTAWLNPGLGAFVKMTTQYTDTLGTTNLTYELASTTVVIP